MMNRKPIFTLFGLMLVLSMSTSAYAAKTLNLVSFTDNSPATINLPATKLLMATVGTTATQGGTDAIDTIVSINGSVVAADIAQVCVDYNLTEIVCVANPGSLSNISLALTGTQKGGANFEYFVGLNSSAGGKNISLTVESISSSDTIDSIPLPQATALRSIAGTSTPPSVDTPTFTSVLINGATLGGNITDLGTSPTSDDHGTVWNHTGAPVTQNASSLVTPSLGTFTDVRIGMNTADQVFFRAFITQSSTDYFTAESSFYTYPNNDPTGFSIDQVTSNSMRVNWSDSSESGDAGGSIVIVSGVNGTITAPGDGNDYTGDPVWPFSESSGTDDWVAYKGKGGSSVTLTNLPENSQFWVAIYSYSGTGTGTSGVRYKATTAVTGTETTLATPPVVGNPTFSAVQNNGATLGVDSVTGSGIDDKGTAWKYTTGVVETDNKLTFGTGTGSFSHSRTPMNSADEIFFKAYAHNSGGYTLTTESSFHTYPANDPTIGAFTGTDDSNITINWTNSSESGDAGGSIVVVSEVSSSIAAPTDGTDYSPDATYPFSAPTSGGDDYVVYKGTGTSVTISSLPPETQFWVTIYSASGLGTSGLPGVRYKIDGTPATGTETTDAAATPPVVISPPVFTNVGTTSADLGGTVTDLGIPVATLQGTVWNETGGPVTENNQDEAVTLNVPFTQSRTGMKSADQVFFSSYAKEGTNYTYSSVASFHTYPANDPTIGAFSGIDDTNITINWTNSSETGDAAGTIVVVSTTNDGFTVPSDGTDYTPNAVYPFTDLGGNDYVVYKGTGTSVTISNLPDTTTFYVAVYSASGLGTSGASGVRYKTPTTALDNAATTAPATPPVVTSPPTFANVGTTSADLGGTVTDLGSPEATLQGTVWNETGGPVSENNQDEAVTLNVPFTQSRTGMKSADQVFFSSYAKEGTNYTYSSVASFHTYPANDPTIGAFSGIGTNSITINWTNSSETGDAAGSIVVVSSVDSTITAPVDGTLYTPDAVAPFSEPTTGGGDDYVIYEGTGSSVTISGLAENTTYYVAIYSASGSGSSGLPGVRYKTPTTAADNATTLSGVSQATNAWFHNIGSTSMSVYWTPGVGDGSIVVMKQGGAVDSTPVDGTEHLADSAFGTGAELGTGNYVLYRGTGGFVHVTGLTQGLTYHVAVFTYTGSGVSIEYLLPSPAIASQITSEHTPHNAAILNVDDTIGCTSGCHGFHGATVIPRGEDQETLCVTCHNPDTGMLGAKDLTNFSLHTNSKGSPPATPGVVDCGSCHELHNTDIDGPLYTYNPDTLEWGFNLHYFRVDKAYVPGALDEEAVLHTDANSEDWAFEDGLAYVGACQICHTNTPTGYQNTSAGDDIHQGGDLGNVNCRGCHDHGGNFAGGGGDCTACHNSEQDKDTGDGNRPRRIVTTEFSGGPIVSSHLPGTLDAVDCEVCHDQSSHQAGQVKLKDPDGGTSITISAYANPADPGGETDAALLTNFCKGCHDSNGANGDTSPFTTAGTTVDISTDWANSSHSTSGSVSCFGDGAFGCHGSGHGGQKLTLLAPSDVGPGTNNSDEREQFCFNCHDGSPAIDILTQFTGAATDFWVKGNNGSSSGADINQRHDVLPADQAISGAMLTCNNCHTPHADNITSPVTLIPFTSTLVRDYDPLGSYVQDGYNFTYANGSNQDPVNPAGCNPANGTPATGCETVPGRTEPDYVEFCLTCHDGTIPPGLGVTMSSGMIDMATAYQADHHGRITGGGAGQGYLKPPWNTVGATSDPDPYASFNCTICHGPHGGDNIYNLRTSINVAGVQMEVGGWTGDTVGEPRASQATDLTTYILPPIDGRNIDETTGVQEDHYWGAWCSFCHQMESHGQDEDNACRSGHMHGGGAF